MKKIIVIIVFIALSLFSCKQTPDIKNSAKAKELKEERQEINIHTVAGGGVSAYTIIEVEGHLYLCNNLKGGIIHLESCPCKTKK